MRVLLVHNYYCIRGGEDVVLEQEMELLRGAGVDVRLFSVRNSEMRSLRAKMIAGLSTIYNPWARRKLAAEIAAFAPDVVHVHNFFPQLSPAIRCVPELEAFSRNAYEKYLENYTPEVNAAALISLYSSLAGAAQCGKNAQLRPAGQDDGLEHAS
jgi:hypothetical protein